MLIVAQTINIHVPYLYEVTPKNGNNFAMLVNSRLDVCKLLTWLKRPVHRHLRGMTLGCEGKIEKTFFLMQIRNAY